MPVLEEAPFVFRKIPGTGTPQIAGQAVQGVSNGAIAEDGAIADVNASTGQINGLRIDPDFGNAQVVNAQGYEVDGDDGESGTFVLGTDTDTLIFKNGILTTVS